MKNQKTRKIELIFYGYGTRQILELDKIDMHVNYPEEGGKLTLPKTNKETSLTLEGNIIKIKYIGKKYLRKLKNG